MLSTISTSNKLVSVIFTLDIKGHKGHTDKAIMSYKLYTMLQKVPHGHKSKGHIGLNKTIKTTLGTQPYTVRALIDHPPSIYKINFSDQILKFQTAETHTKPQPITMKLPQYLSLVLIHPKIT